MAQAEALSETEAEARPEQRPDASRRALESAGLIGLTAIAAGLRLWRLDQNGMANEYYSAAVRSMLLSWTNFFFGSFDPIGFVTVDKPPVALWIQAASARLLGYSGFSVILPQALMGVASVILIYHLVRRVFGVGAGLLAGLVLAITPIGIAVDRDNLPDSALTLILLLASWALARATETGRLSPLLAAAALVGLGFETKMLAAFVVLPTFYLVYLVASPVDLRSRVAHLTIATGVVIAVSLAWPIAVELTPKDRRPYIGGSANNSAMELALGYNGLARITGMGQFGPRGPGGPPGFGGPPGGSPAIDGGEPPGGGPAKAAATKDGAPEPTVAVPPLPGGPRFGPGGPPGPGGMGGFGGRPGLLRFTNHTMAGLITWLLPLAIIGTAAAALRIPRRWPPGPEHAAILLWSGWFATHWLVFSFAQGIFHEYYTYVMGPAVAAMAAIGTLALLAESREGGWRRFLLPAAILLTAAWQSFIVYRGQDWAGWLLPPIVGGATIGAAGLIAGRWLGSRSAALTGPRWSAAIGLSVLLIGPATWSLTPVLARGNGVIPTADPSMVTGRRVPGAPPGGPPPFGGDAKSTDKLVAFLRANRHGERIMLAAPSAMEVSSIIALTGEPAVSLGGFMGSDPVLTKEEFVDLVEEKDLRFVLIMPGPDGGGFPGGRPGGRGGHGGPGGFGPPGGPPFQRNSEIMTWVREHGKPVDSNLWKTEEPPDSPEEAGPGGPPASGADPGAPGEEPGGPGGSPGGPGGGPPGGPGMFRRMARLYDCKPELGLAAPEPVDRSKDQSH